jgi:mannose-6-phosphate isomerase-like protein (cupin superfamily)
MEYADGVKGTYYIQSGQSIDIPVLTWHKAINIGNKPAKVIEVWMGSELTEQDIERRD